MLGATPGVPHNGAVTTKFECLEWTSVAVVPQGLADWCYLLRFPKATVLSTGSKQSVVMKTLIIGIGGMTNGGKSTLSKALQKRLLNSCIISQDTFFKDDSLVPVDSQGFKQYDLLSALHMDRMMEEVEAWQEDPRAFMASHTGVGQLLSERVDQQVYVLIIEGFLIFNYRALNELMNKKYFLQIPYETCKQRRSSRVYTPPDPPGYFDGHVWPMYLNNRKEMEEMVTDLVLLDGLTEREKLLSSVLEDVTADIEALRQG